MNCTYWSLLTLYMAVTQFAAANYVTVLERVNGCVASGRHRFAWFFFVFLCYYVHVLNYYLFCYQLNCCFLRRKYLLQLIVHLLLCSPLNEDRLTRSIKNSDRLIYICVCVCVYICIYIYVCMYIYIQNIYTVFCCLFSTFSVNISLRTERMV